MMLREISRVLYYQASLKMFFFILNVIFYLKLRLL